MTPFKDTSISLIDGEEQQILVAPKADTVAFDSYRQGSEVTLVNYFMRSTLPYMSSKGLKNSTLNTRVVPELEANDLGQNILTTQQVPFEDASDRLTAAEILSANATQNYDDERNDAFSNDGKITVFSDDGKVELFLLPRSLNSKGFKASLIEISSETFKNSTVQSQLFYDCVDQINTIPVQGYTVNNQTTDPFKEKDLTNDFYQKIEYSYIGQDERTYSRGWSYGTSAGTDSIAFGGLLR